MSEQVIGDEPRRSGYREYETKTTATLINTWFKGVAAVLSHEAHKNLHIGQFQDIHTEPGVGKIVARYEGCTPHASLGDYLLRVYMVAEGFDVRDTQATGTGWHMQFTQTYGGKLKPMTPAATEELMGSTSEQRTELEAMLKELHDSYVSKEQPGVESAEVVQLFAGL
jgi:hypothetical protein